MATLLTPYISIESPNPPVCVRLPAQAGTQTGNAERTDLAFRILVHRLTEMLIKTDSANEVFFIFLILTAPNRNPSIALHF